MTIDDCIKEIQDLKKKQLELAAAMLQAYKGSIYPLDLYALGAVKRSLALSSAFCLLIEKKNFVAAAGLLRMQLDTALRFYASFLVSDPHKFAEMVLTGTHVRKLKDRKGEKMTDKYLVDCASNEYPWIKDVYEKASGYVHLSDNHFMRTIHDFNDEANIVTMNISDKDESLPTSIYIEACQAFCEATKMFMRLLAGWIVTKDNPELIKKLRENVDE